MDTVWLISCRSVAFWKFFNARSIGIQLFANASSSNITRLPTLEYISCLILASKPTVSLDLSL